MDIFKRLRGDDMQNNFVAIAVKGKEFLYKRSSMIAVPNGRAQDVIDVLNKRKVSA